MKRLPHSQFFIRNSKFDRSIETLRLALQRERGSFSNWSTEARPFARSSVVGSEVGAKLKGLDELLKDREKEKGALRPFVAVSGSIAVLGRIYIAIISKVVSGVTK